jgi:AcrR family transcriptional regulator
VSSKDKLIDATVELLWERGFGATSPAAIQQRAGVGQGPMYHHFTGKADLAAAALERIVGQMSRDTDAVLAAGGTAVARVRAYLDLDRRPLRGCRLGRLAQEPDVLAQPRLREPIGAFFNGLRDRITEVLAAGLRAGQVRAGTDPRAVASTVVATVQGGYVGARAELSEDVYQLAVDGLKFLLAGIDLAGIDLAGIDRAGPPARPGADASVPAGAGR